MSSLSSELSPLSPVPGRTDPLEFLFAPYIAALCSGDTLYSVRLYAALPGVFFSLFLFLFSIVSGAYWTQYGCSYLEPPLFPFAARALEQNCQVILARTRYFAQTFCYASGRGGSSM